MKIPGFARHGVDHLDEGMSTARRVDGHTGDDRDGTATIRTDALEIPALKIALSPVAALKTFLMPQIAHRTVVRLSCQLPGDCPLLPVKVA